jgi:CheY-like chemotaxis protein
VAALIDEDLERVAPPDAGHPTTGVTGRRPRPVALVAVPNPTLREAVAQGLRARGVTVDQAADGIGALLALAQRSPDLVVLDMDVPYVSGHRVFKVLRQDAATRCVPVVMLADAALQEVSLDPSAGPLPDCFLQKPVTGDAVVHELIRSAATTGQSHG